ncbi:MAG: serine/threonine protein kinase [Deltaproteobacteria bacterium]|nr:serine/threonine protein kinase [Deltaproteobacteria bacterium]
MQPAPEVQARVGTVLCGKYAVRRVLGSGGMGVVYEALNTWTLRPVALKVLRPELCAQVELVRRFVQEAQATAALRHPNLCEVLDLCREEGDGSLCIVQEYLDGADLRRVLDLRERLTAREALGVLLPAMDALATAHEHGVVHRDVKPENLFLARDPGGRLSPRVLDFGVSKVTHEGAFSGRTTLNGASLGTPQYMSPEQACGVETVDARSDVWSVAVVLFECLSGVSPFEAESPADIADSVLSRPIPRLAERAPWVPRALAEAVQRGLERDLAARYPDLRAFQAALRACGLGEGSCQGLLDDGPLSLEPEAPAHSEFPTAEHRTLRASAPTEESAEAFPLVRASSPPPASARAPYAVLLAGVALLLALLPAGISAGMYLGRRSAAARASVAVVVSAPTS